MKNRVRITGILTGGILVLPFFTAALTIEEIKIEISNLLARVATLQQQLKDQSPFGTTTPERIPERVTPTCYQFDRNVSPGERGDTVRKIQEFLSAEGYLKSEATGYFGNATKVAVQRWQEENGVTALGTVGPLTRERMKKRCETPRSDYLAVSPKEGQAPLTITVNSYTGDMMEYRPSMVDGQDTLIDFGDRSERQWVQCASRRQPETSRDIVPGAYARCDQPVSFKHTYEKEGTYTISIVRAGGMCVGGCPETVIASETFVVGVIPGFCTKQYQPVCGAKPVVCIASPCNPVLTTYSNACMMRADKATLLYEGQCRDSVISDPEKNPRCKAWFDGCNQCGRSEIGSPAYCTLRACTAESMQKPYCTAYFDDVIPGNRPPVISSFSGPVLIAAHEIGTWSITATDPENDRLTYSIVWGDEWHVSDAAQRSLAPGVSIQQNTTFTHSYARPGNYTVALTVSDAQGATARTTASVQVNQTSCTTEYAPVCGRPIGCANTCSGFGCSSTLACPLKQVQTYSNRCAMNNANATFEYEGVCSVQ
jgi:peptidoglycan hydrolase-like protein with peptidoglycan-binding domain